MMHKRFIKLIFRTWPQNIPINLWPKKLTSKSSKHHQITKNNSILRININLHGSRSPLDSPIKIYIKSIIITLLIENAPEASQKQQLHNLYNLEASHHWLTVSHEPQLSHNNLHLLPSRRSKITLHTDNVSARFLDQIPSFFRIKKKKKWVRECELWREDQ